VSFVFPSFAYMSTKLLPPKTSNSQPFSMILSWTILPSSRAITMAHAFNTPTKVTKFDYTPSSCISWNNLSAFCPWLHCICPNIMVVQVTTSQDGILLNISQTSSMLPHFAYISTKWFPSIVDHLQMIEIHAKLQRLARLMWDVRFVPCTNFIL